MTTCEIAPDHISVRNTAPHFAVFQSRFRHFSQASWPGGNHSIMANVMINRLTLSAQLFTILSRPPKQTLTPVALLVSLFVVVSPAVAQQPNDDPRTQGQRGQQDQQKQRAQ